MKNRGPFENVDEYIAAAPEDVRPHLEAIRRTIDAALPGAVEAIKYGIPTFVVGRNVIHFGAFERHIGVYPVMTDDRDLASELAPWRASKGTMRIPFDGDVPLDLIARLAKSNLRRVQSSAARKGPSPG